MRNDLVAHIQKYPDVLMYRDFMIDMLTESELLTEEDLSTPEYSKPEIRYVGRLLLSGNKVATIDENDNIVPLFKHNMKERPYAEIDSPISVKPVNNTTKVSTTLGRYLLNHVLLVIPFGDTIPYINAPIRLRDIDAQIVNLMLNDVVTVAQVKVYLKNVHFLRVYSDLVVPSLSVQSISVDPKVIALRNKLLKENKDKLDDVETMIDIQDQLIKLDTELGSKDPDGGYLTKGKNFETHRKRMFGLVGLIPAFGDDKNFNFSTTNYDDGWKREDLPILMNDVRSGAFGRAKETEKGGAETKYLLRAFQEARISEDDCKSLKGVPILVTADIMNPANTINIIDRFYISKGKTIMITADSTSLIGKSIKLRDPMFCTAKDGYCYTCMGDKFRKMEIRSLSAIATSIGSTFLLISMKKMHSVVVETFVLNNSMLRDMSCP